MLAAVFTQIRPASTELAQLKQVKLCTIVTLAPVYQSPGYNIRELVNPLHVRQTRLRTPNHTLPG